MRWGRIGGVLIVGGSVLSVAAVALAGPAGPGDTGRRDIANLVINASLVLLGSGASVLGLFGPSPLHGRTVRIGLGTLAVGLVGLLVSSIIPIPAGSNSLQSWPYIISGAIGLSAMALGSLLTVLALVGTPGPSRGVGSVFLTGLLLFALAIPLNAWLLQQLALTLVLLGVTGVGLLAINGDRSAADASA